MSGGRWLTSPSRISTVWLGAPARVTAVRPMPKLGTNRPGGGCTMRASRASWMRRWTSRSDSPPGLRCSGRHSDKSSRSFPCCQFHAGPNRNSSSSGASLRRSTKRQRRVHRASQCARDQAVALDEVDRRAGEVDLPATYLRQRSVIPRPFLLRVTQHHHVHRSRVSCRHERRNDQPPPGAIRLHRDFAPPDSTGPTRS
jgi:hypothetical protein